MTYIQLMLLLAVVIGAIAVVGFFLSRGGKRGTPMASFSSSAVVTPNKEPTFGLPTNNDTVATVTHTQPSAVVTPPEESENSATVDIPADLPSPNEVLLEIDICYTMRVYCARPLSAQRFVPFVEKLKLRADFIKILGFDEATENWQTITGNDDNYRYWLLAIPLADRGGMLTEDKMRIINEDLNSTIGNLPGVRVVLPPPEETLETAKLLDKFCNEVDKILDLRVAFVLPDGDVSRVHEAIAMLENITMETKEKYVCRQASEVLFNIIYKPQSGRKEQTITFSLDAPRVTYPEKTFNQMVDYANRLSSMLNGVITDPSGQAIDEQRFADIRHQLAGLCQLMKSKGVPPGSATARLLFS